MATNKAQKEVLGVRLSRGGRVIKDFDLKNDFTIGGMRTDSNLIAWDESDEKWVFLRVSGGQSSLLFDDKVQGTISVEGNTVDIHSLKSLGSLSQANDKYVLPIRMGQSCSVTLNGMDFYLEYRPAREIPAVKVPRIKEDKTTDGFFGLGVEELNYYKSLGITLFLGVAFFVLTQVVEPPDHELRMDDLVKRVTKLEVPETAFETDIGDEVAEEVGGGGGGGGGGRGGGGEGPAMPSTGVIAAITTLGSGSGKSIADILGASTGGLGGDLDSMADGIGGLSAGTGAFGGLGTGFGDGTGGGLGGDGEGLGLMGGPGGGLGGGKTMHKKTVKVTGSVNSVGGAGASDATRSRGAINAKIRAHLAGIQNLYNSELKKNPNMAGGKIVVRFTIGASGSVTAASIVSNGTGSSTLASGILVRVRGWRFPAASGDVTVVYPFVFVTSG